MRIPIASMLAPPTGATSDLTWLSWRSRRVPLEALTPAAAPKKFPAMRGSVGRTVLRSRGSSEGSSPLKEVAPSAPGARVGHRYVGGRLTLTRLWPWPMNQRIKDATLLARGEATDVTSDIEGPLRSDTRGLSEHVRSRVRDHPPLAAGCLVPRVATHAIEAKARPKATRL